LRRTDRKGAVLRSEGGARQLRYVRGLEDRSVCPRADAADRAIPGLYAVGADAASVMGGHYPSGGINLGPAMTFGFIAGLHAAGIADTDRASP
jgi:succinate dehydrogenase/fumarate reductase flavoprotein subunit